ncbi:MAG TPA: hypothetical protein VJI98_03085 [Candidatus Nanoarchaeia archaeon]|nr:hypothetical protein [Candidatus Nanoarchaeia archaeon]
MSKKPPTTGDRLRAQHQWHARFTRGGFSTMIFPIKEMATPPVKIHWWKNHILILTGQHSIIATYGVLDPVKK